MTSRQAIARRHLESQLHPLRTTVSIHRPARGWVRAIRDALGMSTAEMASRLHVSQQAVSELEQNEQDDAIKLATLRRAADALECDLVYALVPRAPLDDMVLAQARRQARRRLAQVGHHSRLEDQVVSAADDAAQVEDLADDLVDRRGLWREPTR
jgi:predicted DNA-binding mobile mystery protein A